MRTCTHLGMTYAQAKAAGRAEEWAITHYTEVSLYERGKTTTRHPEREVIADDDPRWVWVTPALRGIPRHAPRAEAMAHRHKRRGL